MSILQVENVSTGVSVWGLRLASRYVGRYLDKYLEKPIRVGLWQLFTEHFVAQCIRSSVQVPVRRGQHTTSHSGDGGPRTWSLSALGPERPEDRVGMTAVFSLEVEVTVSVSQASQ